MALSLLYLPGAFFRLANNYFGTDISNYDEDFPTGPSPNSNLNVSNRSLFSPYNEYGEEISTFLERQNDNNNELYQRIRMMIAEDQIEHFLIENHQLRSEKDDEIDELRATIRLLEERRERWDRNQGERQRIREDELRRYRFRIRELLELISRVIGSDQKGKAPDAVAMAARKQIKELTDENTTLNEENRRMREEIVELNHELMKHHQSQQVSILSPTRRLLPLVRVLLGHFKSASESPSSPSVHSAESLAKDHNPLAGPQQHTAQKGAHEATGESGAAAADAGGDHEWTLEEAEVRGRLLAKQSLSEECLTSSRRTTPEELKLPPPPPPPPSFHCQFGELDAILSDDDDDEDTDSAADSDFDDADLELPEQDNAGEQDPNKLANRSVEELSGLQTSQLD